MDATEASVDILIENGKSYRWTIKIWRELIGEDTEKLCRMESGFHEQ